jgi:hypothetical protein
MLLFFVATSGTALGEDPQGYQIAGICQKKGPDQPKAPDEGHAVRFHDFAAVPAETGLDSRVSPCPRDRLEGYVAYAQRHAAARSGLSDRDLEWWDEAIGDPITLTETKRCAILTDGGTQSGLLILRTKLDATRSRHVAGNQLLSLVQLDPHNLPLRFLKQFLTNESDFDIVREVSVKYLCDADNDRRVELLLLDRRYAGHSYLLCAYDRDFAHLSCDPIAGASGG